MNSEVRELSQRLGAALVPLGQIQSINATKSSINTGIVANNQKKWSRFGGLWKMIVGFFGAVFVLSVIMRLLFGNEFVHNNIDAATLFCAICGAVVVFIGIPILSSIVNAQLDKKNEELEEMYDSVNEQIKQVYIENKATLDLLPPDYRYYDAIEYMKRALDNGRADNMKEAINLYEEQMHRDRLEAGQQQLLAQQQEIAEMVNWAAQEASNASTMATAAMWAQNDASRRY